LSKNEKTSAFLLKNIEIGIIKIFYKFDKKNCDDGVLEAKVYRPLPDIKPLSLVFHDPSQLKVQYQNVQELDLLLINNQNQVAKIKIDKMVQDDSLISIHKIILQLADSAKESSLKNGSLVTLSANDSVFIKLVIFGKMKGTALFNYLKFTDAKKMSLNGSLEYSSFQIQVLN
jgi:DNA uptake protein ComE-like DNA-binding protein